ncbi:S41 family peptidase [bacterium]|nr:MAG: S41 family peptidase [bacterium]
MFKLRRIIISTMIILITLVAIFISQMNVDNVSAEGEPYKEVKIFVETIALIKKNYVDEVKDKDLVRGAIKGMLTSLDPHSSFMPPEVYKELQVNTKGEFGGLGIQISIKDGVLTVIAPIEDTPAYKAGIKAGDKIIKINGKTTKDMSLHDAVTKLRGPRGTSVTITIFREGLEKPKDIKIVRDIIKIKSVKSKVIDDNIGYVKILEFQQKTGKELKKAMEKLAEEEINALILDLRNNPGGLLTSSIDVSSQFLSPDKLVVYIKDRKGEKTKYFSRKTSRVYDYPMIVLVNQGSASASEIVAGALQDWGKAVVLGTQTFGKGSVQTVIPLSDGSGLRLTTARYYTPKDRSIQAKGIEPDIAVELVSADGVKGHPAIREKDLERHLDNDTEEKQKEGMKLEEEEKKDNEIKDKDEDKEGEEEEPERMRLPRKEISEEDDMQLQRAIDLLKIWRVFKKLPEAA